MQTLSNISAFLNSLTLKITGKLFLLSQLALFLMVLPTTVDVIGGLFGRPLASAQEFTEVLELIMVYTGIGYIQAKRNNIMVEMFYERFSRPVQKVLDIVLVGVTGVVFCFVSWRLGVLALDKLHSGEITLLLEFPVYIMPLVGAMGCIFMVLAIFANVLEDVCWLVQERKIVLLLLAFFLLVVLATSGLWLSSYPWLQHRGLLGALGMLFLMVMLMLGCPVGLAMMCIGLIGLLLSYRTASPAYSMLGVSCFSTAKNYMYSVVPMFVLMGEFAAVSGISRDLFSAAKTWLGRLPGGLAVASVSGCAGFAAVSGDSMATAVTMSSVALPEMEKQKYDSGFACATLAAGGTLGILIPPSTGFIFYSLVTEVSIARLFMAGVIPGILLALLFILVVFWYARRNPDKAPAGQSTTFREKIFSLKKVIAMIILITIVLGSILTGKCSPTQGGAIGAAGTLLLSLCMRRMTWKNFLLALQNTTEITIKLMVILLGVGLIGNFFATTRVPFILADMVVNVGANRYLILGAVIVLYIILGCMINVIPMILLTLPAIYPTILAVGFDPVWFGVVSVILMEMGQVTPPVGINVFAMGSAAPWVSLARIFKNVVPYFVMMFVMIFLLILFPGLATWLPHFVV